MNSTRRRSDKPQRRGFLIVVVTIVIMLVSLAAYSFLAMMVSENKAARARGDQLQAEAVALSGREFLAAILEMPRSKRPPDGDSKSLPDLFAEVLVDGESDLESSQPEEGERQGRFCLLVGDASELSARPFRYGYVNESAKLNLASLVQWDQQQPGVGREALMNLPGMDESVADALLDWVDADDIPRDLGAESEFYSGLDSPYQPRNGTPQSLDELLLVRGVTREQLLGADLNLNYRLDAWESNLVSEQATQSTGEQQRPWSHFLTVFSGERVETYEGEQKIQVNQEELGVLHQELAGTQAAWANFIVAYRQFGPYTGSRSGEEAANYAVDTSIPAARRIESLLDLIGIRVAIRDEEDKIERVLASPFTDQPAQLQEYLPKMFDQMTVGDGQPIAGRVNINLAPREVLTGVPGIEPELIEPILAARGYAEQGESRRREAVWLLAENIVDRSAMRKLLPYITAGGDVARAQVIGYYDLRSPIMRFETVLDATSKLARQVYYKDLRRLGRGALLDIIGSDDGGVPMDQASELF